MSLTILKLEFVLIIPWNHYLLEGTSQNFVENQQFNVMLSFFETILESHVFNITYLHTGSAILWAVSGEQ
jgi:hypothetical protein